MTEKNTAIQTILNTPIVYSVTDEALKILEEKWQDVPDCADRESYELVRVGISEVVGLRTSVEKRRKELKSDSLEYGRRVDSAAKVIKDRLMAIETPLKDAKGKIDDAKRLEKERKAQVERERVEAIQIRIQAIKDLGVVEWGETSEGINDRCMAVERERLNETDFQEFFNEAFEVKKAVVNALIKARDVAQAKEKKDAAERVRQQLVQAEQEKEAARLRAEREEQEAENKRLEEEREKQRKIEERELALEREKIEHEKKKIAEKQAMVDAENEKLRVEKEAQELLDREKEADRQNAETQNKRFDEIVKAIEKCSAPTGIAGAIVSGEIPWVKYTG